MAKDPTDRSTLDFIAPEMHVFRGQVLSNRDRQIAVVARKGRNCAYLLGIKSGTLRVAQVKPQELVENWSEADCCLSHALSRLREQGRVQGASQAALEALDKLSRAGREPLQRRLF